MEWIKCSDRMPEKTEENDGKVFYTFSYGVVSDYEWFSSYPREGTGWSGDRCEGGYFYGPNSDSDYGGEFRVEGVTHWMEKPPLPPLPEPPK